jgi:hypothetical protein
MRRQRFGAFGRATDTEDCLFLNVFSPGDRDDRPRRSRRSPRPASPPITGARAGIRCAGKRDRHPITERSITGILAV